MADIDKLFEQVSSEILTEETKLAMAVLFENQLNEAIKAKEEQLQEDNKREISDFKEGLVTKIDEYLKFFSEEFVKNNATQIQESVKIKTSERVLKAFDSIMKDFHYQLDEKKISNEDKLTESRKEINRLTKQLIDAKKETKKIERASIVVEASTKLDSDLQRDKLVQFSKTVEFDELFEGKINAFVKTVLAESKVEQQKQKEQTQLIVEEQVTEEKKVAPQVTTSPLDKYLDNL
jgi:hypothetical protein